MLWQKFLRSVCLTPPATPLAVLVSYEGPDVQVIPVLSIVTMTWERVQRDGHWDRAGLPHSLEFAITEGWRHAGYETTHDVLIADPAAAACDARDHLVTLQDWAGGMEAVAYRVVPADPDAVPGDVLAAFKSEAGDIAAAKPKKR
jgi:hypothetical protein